MVRKLVSRWGLAPALHFPLTLLHLWCALETMEGTNLEFMVCVCLCRGKEWTGAMEIHPLIIHFICLDVSALLLLPDPQSCPTLHDPSGSLGSLRPWILRARVEWVAVTFSSGDVRNQFPSC